MSDSLFSNSVYLMASTLVQAVLGFGFWVICARNFSADEIGLASALISAATFIAYVSLFGFNSAFIRFLPTSNRRNEKINSGLVIVLLVATAISTLYVVALPWFSPKLAFVTADAWLAVGFVILSALGAANLLTDSVFIAYRASHFNLGVYSIQSTIKLALPLLLVSLGAFGVYAASGLAAAVALLLSLGAMVIWHQYRPALVVSRPVLKTMWQFASASYVANLLNIVPTLVLPIVILDRIGAAAAGYYYLALMLVNLVYSIGYSVCQSLFAEGSYGDQQLGGLVLRAVRMLMALMVPAGIGLAVLGPYILRVFGKSYDSGSSLVLAILALAAPAVTAYVMSGIILRLRKQTAALIWSNVFYTVCVCGLAWWWAGGGLVMVAWAWLLGNALTAAVSLWAIWARRSEATTQEA